LNLIELNSIWVRALPGPTHLDLRTGSLWPMCCTKLVEPCSFSKVPNGLLLSFLMSSGSEKKELRCVSEWSQGTHTHTKCGL